jgi:glutamate transport system substrate-binding protein
MDTKLRIGVHSNIPGIGYDEPSSYQWSGLDIEVARYILKWLHIPSSSKSSDASRTHLYGIDSTDRDTALRQHDVDLIIASYSITDGRIKEGISFSIPYLLSFQGILVRPEDAGIIKTVDDLRGKKVCAGPPDGTPYQHLASLNETRRLNITIKSEIGPDACVADLRNKTVDAVVNDDAVLLGYLADGLVLTDTKIWPRPEQYGVGFTGSPADAEEINAAIRSMIRDGSWRKAVIDSFCPTADPCSEANIFLDNPPPTG